MGDRSPLVSICIPVYNHELYVEECIRAALGQSYPEIEVIVVDDCSSDNSHVIAAAIKDPRLIVLKNARRLGIGANWNRAVRESRGEFVVIVPSDDALEPEHVKELLAIMVPDHGMAFAGVAAALIGPHGQSLGENRRQRISLDAIDVADSRELWRWLFGTRVVFSGTMFRRSCYDAIGGFDEELVIAEDRDFWVRLLLRWRYAYLNRLLVKFRWHPYNTSGVSSNARLHFTESAIVQGRIVASASSVRVILAALPALVWLVVRAVRDRRFSFRERLDIVGCCLSLYFVELKGKGN
jgi:glycosyltransferase involved in cell wall biosynthesis